MYNLAYLVENGYLDKKLGDDYTGSVFLAVDPTNGTVSSKIIISNGIYSYDGEVNAVNTGVLKSGASVTNDCSNFTDATSKKCGKLGTC